jgi:hypothetical protein
MLLGDAVPLETAAGGYRMDVPEGELDLHRFRSLVRMAHQTEALEAKPSRFPPNFRRRPWDSWAGSSPAHTTVRCAPT